MIYFTYNYLFALFVNLVNYNTPLHKKEQYHSLLVYTEVLISEKYST